MKTKEQRRKKIARDRMVNPHDGSRRRQVQTHKHAKKYSRKKKHKSVE